jgi:uncharacterized protein (TIGR02600 family)
MESWSGLPGTWVDLNEPIRARSGRPSYPIADPTRLNLTDGYALRQTPPGASALQPLPLPVCWFYVLKDGSMVVPQSEDADGAHFNPAQVTASNPIAGRIAFWTDDESCKLNLNTASTPLPWDRPAANTLTERAYAEISPVAAQNYADSSHPAFTSLTPVLKHFSAGHQDRIQWPPTDAADPFSAASQALWRNHLGCYQSISPTGAWMSDTSSWLNQNNRRYPTVNEFFFATNRQQNGATTGFAMMRQDLEQTHFLLTTHSASPELNPFGQPKIPLWMLPQEPLPRTVTEQRIHSLSSITATQPLAFQRASIWSDAANQGSSQSPTADWDDVPRNRQLYAWLQSQTNQPMPGVGASFASKYGTRSRDQTLLSMLDMLRWATPATQALPPSTAVNHHSAVPLQLTRSEGSADLRGFGRFPTITEVAIVFAFTDVERVNGLPLDANGDGICDRATKLRAFMVINPCIVASGPPAVSASWSVRIRRLQHFTIGQGVGLLLPGGNVRNRCAVSNLSALQGSGRAWGGGHGSYACFASQFLQPDGTPKLIGRRDDPARDFPFISNNDVRLPTGSGAPGSSLRFSGGAVIVDMMEPNASQTSPRPNDSIHSVEVLFPDRAIPMPRLLVEDFVAGPRVITQRFTPTNTQGELRLPIIQRGDIVRSMVLNAQGPTGADTRLLAAQRDVFLSEDSSSEPHFITHPDYSPAGVPLSEAPPQAQSLRDAAYLSTGQYGGPMLQPTVTASGQLLPGVTFARQATPNAPVTLHGAMQIAAGHDAGGRLGDWESGMGILEDGASVNRFHSFTSSSFSRSGAIVDDARPPPLTTAVAFGALPSGVYGDAHNTTPRPWQTLLFCPNPAGRTSSSSESGRFDSSHQDHPGFATPRDHLWLEFFWQPVTAPRPLSSEFATQGKVNLNFQIQPWTWLRRSTAIHGALHGVRLTALPTAALTSTAENAKGHLDGSPLDVQFRYRIDPDKTLAAFEARFDAGDLFRTASEVCDMFLVPSRIIGHNYDSDSSTPRDPTNLSASDMTTWWNGEQTHLTDAFEATGDNLREAPYSQIYPRVCTQSNVFKLHYRVQSIQKARSVPEDTFDSTRDRISADRRGSHLIERRYKPSATPRDPVTEADAPSLHTQQEFRSILHETFSP